MNLLHHSAAPTDANLVWGDLDEQGASNPRPMYFSQSRIDPNNDQRIYVLGVQLHILGRSILFPSRSRNHEDFLSS